MLEAVAGPGDDFTNGRRDCAFDRGHWNTWANDLAMKKTEDAYVRADLASLSTRVAGLVATHLTNSSFAAVTLGKVMQKAGYLLDSETANALPSFRRIQPGVWVVNSGASLVGYFGRLELYNTLAKGVGKSKVSEMVRAIKLSLRAGQDLFSATVTLFLSGFDKLPIVNEAGTISVMYDPC